MIDRTYENKLYQTPKFAGAFRYNVQKGCAALSCRACVDPPTCVAVRYLTLRIGYERHGSKNPLPFPYSLSSANFAVLRGNGEIHKRGGNLGVHPSYAPARRQRTFLPSADGEFPC